MDADEFRDYILGFIFYKYLSEKQHLFANKLLETDAVKDYALLTDAGDLEAIREEFLEKLGCFLKPEELFSAVAKRGNVKVDEEDEKTAGNFILEDLQSILNAIEQSTMGNDSEDDFNKLFEDIDLASTKLGRSTTNPTHACSGALRTPNQTAKRSVTRISDSKRKNERKRA